jgi:hypothetical protein
MSRHSWYTSRDGKSLYLEMGWDQWRGLTYTLWEPNAWREERVLACSHYSDPTPIEDMSRILGELKVHGITPPDTMVQAVLLDQANRDGERILEHT